MPRGRTIRIDDYAQLKRLAWNLPVGTTLSPTEALNLYERNWRHVDSAALSPIERAFIESLVQTVGRGHLLV
jgi:hypothetical protein